MERALSTPRKILVIAHELSSYGGMQFYVRSFAEALTPIHAVKAVTRDTAPPDFGRRTRSRRKVVALAEQLAVSVRHWPDVIVADQVQSAVVNTPLRSSTRTCFIHAAELTGGGAQRLKRLTLRAQDRIWGPTRWVCDYAVERFGIEPDVPRVIRPPVDCNVFVPCDTSNQEALRAELGLAGDRAVVLCVARLDSASRHKGVDLTITACCNHLRDIRPQLVVIGGGDDIGRLRAIADGSPDVTFVGPVRRALLARYMAAADVFSMPSHESPFGRGVRTEGFGIVFLEAAASGVPSVRGIAAGTAEAVIDGVTAVRAEPDPVSIASAIRYWLELDAVSSARVREACRDWALLHSVERFVQACRAEIDGLDV